MIWAQLETRNFTFDAFGKTREEARNVLETACFAHAKQYRVDAQYFLDLINDDDGANVRWTEFEVGRAYRDSQEIVR
jgi:hypothetical protein